MPLVDDKSRMTFVYFLKHKSEALEIFKNYISMAERQVGKQLKQLED